MIGHVVLVISTLNIWSVELLLVFQVDATFERLMIVSVDIFVY